MSNHRCEIPCGLDPVWGTFPTGVRSAGVEQMAHEEWYVCRVCGERHDADDVRREVEFQELQQEREEQDADSKAKDEPDDGARREG